MIAPRRSWHTLKEFLFPLETDAWLACLRIGAGLQIIFYTLSFRDDWMDVFALNANGLVSREIAEAVTASDSILAPRVSWLTDAAGRLGITESIALSVTWWLLLAAGAFLAVGLFPERQLLAHGSFIFVP